jgi:hypothetical protein
MSILRGHETFGKSMMASLGLDRERGFFPCHNTLLLWWS